MNEQDGQAEIPEDTPAAKVASGTSMLEAIQKRRSERLNYIQLNIPSWGNDLKARYEVIPKDELEAMLKKLSHQSKVDTDKGDLDFLIRACSGVVAVDVEGDGDEQVIATGYTQALAGLLGVDTTTARELVRYMFKNNGIAVAAHAQRVAKWMTDPSADLGDDALGM